MTVSYPRALPFEEILSVEFELLEGVSQNRLKNGQIQTREFATPVWSAKYATARYCRVVPGHMQRIAAWRAWWSSLRGTMGFLAYDPSMSYPAQHMHGAGLGGWGGTGTVGSLSARSASISGLPSALKLSPGDMVSFIKSGAYSLHRILEPANGSSVSISFEPFIDPTAFAGATANFIRAAALMIPVPGSFQASQSVEPASISFEGIQRVM